MRKYKVVTLTLAAVLREIKGGKKALAAMKPADARDAFLAAQTRVIERKLAQNVDEVVELDPTRVYDFLDNLCPAPEAVAVGDRKWLKRGGLIKVEVLAVSGDRATVRDLLRGATETVNVSEFR